MTCLTAVRLTAGAVTLALAASRLAAQQPAPPAAPAAAADTTRAPRDEVDPNTSRLFFAPTGRTPRAGSVYIGDVYLFFPSVGGGLTDRVGLVAGVSIIPGATSQLVYVAPKIGVVQSRSVNLAVGGIYITIPGESGYGAGGYVAATLGGEDRAVSLVVGYPLANGDRTSEPMILGGGELRLARDIKLLVEGWRLPGVDDVPVIVGFRFLGRRSAFDFGMMRVLGPDVDMRGFPFVPWLGFSFRLD